MKEAFEKWFKYNYKWSIEKDIPGYSLKMIDEWKYEDEIAHHDWRVWQASRAEKWSNK